MRKFILLCCCTAVNSLFAQQSDSIRLNLTQAEEIFLHKNLLLLSMKYQVEAAKANEIQQKLYNNPIVSTELATYGSNKKWADIGAAGQKMFGVDQLVVLAGKRNKRVALAKEQSREASLALYEVMRALKYELRNSFHTVMYADELVKQYDEQMKLLQQIIRSYDEQTDKRNVSLKDAIRLKSEYIQLSSDRNAIIMEGINARQTLQLMLDTVPVIVPEKREAPLVLLPPTPALISIALENRPDLQMEQSRLRQEQLNYKLQKALATPDLMLGAGYDQRGSYINNLYTLRAAIDLPFFNRNQGNIRAANAQVQAAESGLMYKQKEVEKEVLASLSRLKEAEREYQESQKNFNKDFPMVNKSVIENFNKGNLSILEFLDFFENYNSAIRQLNQLEKQRHIAWDEMEFTIGSKLKEQNQN